MITKYQFILHILLSFGRFATEIDLIQHSSLRKAFRYAKLIGMNEDDESLLKYSDQLFTCYIEEQLIFFPNSRQIIDTWIQDAGDIFDDVIIKGSIPITEMPSVQLTSLLKSEEEKCTTLIKKLKKAVLSLAFQELDKAKERCNIPSIDDFQNASKTIH